VLPLGRDGDAASGDWLRGDNSALRVGGRAASDRRRMVPLPRGQNLGVVGNSLAFGVHRSALPAGCLGTVFALRKTMRNLMLAATVCFHLFVVLDLAVTTSRFSACPLPKVLQCRRRGSPGRLSGRGGICRGHAGDAVVHFLRDCDSVDRRAARGHHDGKGKIRQGERLDPGDHGRVGGAVADGFLSARDGERAGRDALVLPGRCAIAAAGQNLCRGLTF
jgi:hypothetical protein